MFNDDISSALKKVLEDDFDDEAMTLLWAAKIELEFAKIEFVQWNFWR